jgi:hypothetical protein
LRVLTPQRGVAFAKLSALVIVSEDARARNDQHAPVRHYRYFP